MKRNVIRFLILAAILHAEEPWRRHTIDAS